MRYLPHTTQDQADMLTRIGVTSINDLFCGIPEDKLLSGPLDLPGHQSELAVLRHFEALASKNRAAGAGPFFVGGGGYRHHVPASVDHLIQRSEFLTAYTPYQPEISQGTLQTLFEFQTQVANLTAMDVANASMYDGSTGTGEAVLMASRLTRRKKAVLAGGLHPHYRAVVENLSEMSGGEVQALAPDPMNSEDVVAAIDEDTACVVVQSPSFYGHLIDLAPIAERAHACGALVVAVFTEAVSLGLIEPGGAQGADIMVGEGQSIGNGLNFGGPYVGLFATRSKFVRQMPGRICGETVDAAGDRGFVLTLSTREQHIRREKATSNICTNSGLCCLAFTIHMTLLGEAGMAELAQANHARACQLADRIDAIPEVRVVNDAFFNEFTVELPKSAKHIVRAMAEKNVLAGIPASRLEPNHRNLENLLIVAATETVTEQDIEAFDFALREVI